VAIVAELSRAGVDEIIPAKREGAGNELAIRATNEAHLIAIGTGLYVQVAIITSFIGFYDVVAATEAGGTLKATKLNVTGIECAQFAEVADRIVW
jgi:hypothetical protein